MKKETSCGAVVYTIESSVVHYLLIQSVHGHYGFPKGHQEVNETEIDTCLREVFEETGLHIHLDETFRTIENYIMDHGINKNVIYFLGNYQNQIIRIQTKEVKQAVLVPFEKALSLLSFEGQQRVLKEADTYLKDKMSTS